MQSKENLFGKKFAENVVIFGIDNSLIDNFWYR